MSAHDQAHQDHLFSERLLELGLWLESQRPFWSERPFVGLPLTWESSEPEMAASLRALPLTTIEAYESRPWDLPHMPSAFRSIALEARAWAALPSLPTGQASAPRPRPRRVPDRKWQQIDHFVKAALPRRPGSLRRWLDWCGGKGHLGRSLAADTGLPLVCVEKSATLCRAGEALAESAGVKARFVVADVLEDDLDGEFGQGIGVVALHACGGLHRKLIERVIATDSSYLVLSPCCYHRFETSIYQPLSSAGRRAGLQLSASHLRLVGLKEVVASPRRQQLRRREQAYRLGLDLLLRQLTGEDRYRPLGPAPRAWADNSFEAFCRSLATREGIDISGADLATAKAQGREKLQVTRALGMIRGIFRGPIEAWLLFDRAQYLIEMGWQVRLGSFCPSRVTPRNSMIVAWRE